jgi:hypothetical protein
MAEFGPVSDAAATAPSTASKGEMPSELLDHGSIDFKLHNTGSAAEFIKIAPSMSKDDIVKYALDGWDLNADPTMLLRISGSEPDRMTEAKEVIEGAIMASHTTNAWIFCAGLDFGLPSIVGQVMQLRRHACEAPLIGVVSFQSVQKNEQLGMNAKGTAPATPGAKRSYTDGKPDPDMSTVSLQPNHTHFVICNDESRLSGERQSQGIDAKAALLEGRKNSFTYAHDIENAMSTHEGRQVPRVLLVVCGDLTTLSELLVYTRAVHAGTASGIVLLASETGGLAAALTHFAKAGELPPGWKSGSVAEQFAELKKLNEEVSGRLGMSNDPWPVLMCMSETDKKDVAAACLNAALSQGEGAAIKIMNCVTWNDHARLDDERAKLLWT